MSNYVKQDAILGVQIKRVEFLIGDQTLELREPSIKMTHEIIQRVVDEELLSGFSRLGKLLSETTPKTVPDDEVEDKDEVLLDDPDEILDGKAEKISPDADDEELLGGEIKDPALEDETNDTAGSTITATWLASHAAEILDILRQSLLPLVTGKAGEAAAVILDTRVNRENLDMKSAALREFVVEEMSLGQAAALVVTVNEMIDWSGLGKTLASLLKARMTPEEKAKSTTSPLMS